VRNHAGNDVARREGSLLNFSKVILGITVKDHFADFDERVIIVRPDLCEIKWVDVKGFRVGFGHDLHANAPPGEVAVLDRLEEIALCVVRVFTAHRIGLFARKALDSLFGLEMPFHVEQFVLR
jgi:hypothetical protein